jgi:hypothetical protein
LNKANPVERSRGEEGLDFKEYRGELRRERAVKQRVNRRGKQKRSGQAMKGYPWRRNKEHQQGIGEMIKEVKKDDPRRYWHRNQGSSWRKGKTDILQKKKEQRQVDAARCTTTCSCIKKTIAGPV